MTGPDDVAQRIQLALDRIRPALQMDGGDIQVLGFDPASGTLRVSLVGACVGCGMSSSTMTLGVERVMRSLVPEVLAVEAV